MDRLHKIENKTEFLDKIIDNLTLLKNNPNSLSRIEKDIILDNLRQAYLLVLSYEEKDETGNQVLEENISKEVLLSSHSAPLLQEDHSPEEYPQKDTGHTEETFRETLLSEDANRSQDETPVQVNESALSVSGSEEPVKEKRMPEPPVSFEEKEPVKMVEPVVEAMTELSLQESEETDVPQEQERGDGPENGRAPMKSEILPDCDPIPELSFSMQQHELEFGDEDDLLQFIAEIPQNSSKPEKETASQESLERGSESAAVPDLAGAPTENFSEPQQTPLPNDVNTMVIEEEIKVTIKSEKRSLNDLLTERREDNSLNTRFQTAKITDLTKSISINDKFLFIRELFRNRGEEFSQAIQVLNNSQNMEQAFEYLDKLKQHYFWDSTSPAYLAFCDLIRRKF